MNKSPQKGSSKTSIILALCTVIFIDTFAMTLVYPLFATLFSLDVSLGGFFSVNIPLSLRNMSYGMTMAIYPIFMFFTAPFLGEFSDQIGRKKVLLICLTGAAIAAGLSGTAAINHIFWLFFISRMIAGSVAGSLPVAQAAISDISNEKDKTVNFSLIGFAFTIGLVLGPIVGGFLSNKDLVSWFGLSTPFFLTTILCLGNALLLILSFKETLIIKANNKRHDLLKILKPLSLFWQAIKTPKIRNLIAICFFYILGWNVYLSFISLHLFQHYNFTSTQIGYFIGWVGLILSVTMAVLIRIFVKYFTTTQILVLAIGLSILGGLCAMIPLLSFQWISALPIACGMGAAYTAITKLFSDSVGTKLQGWIMGISASIMSLAAGFGGLLTGFVSLNYLIAFISIIIMWLLSGMFLWKQSRSVL